MHCPARIAKPNAAIRWIHLVALFVRSPPTALSALGSELAVNRSGDALGATYNERERLLERALAMAPVCCAGLDSDSATLGKSALRAPSPHRSLPLFVDTSSRLLPSSGRLSAFANIGAPWRSQLTARASDGDPNEAAAQPTSPSAQQPASSAPTPQSREPAPPPAQDPASPPSRQSAGPYAAQQQPETPPAFAQQVARPPLQQRAAQQPASSPSRQPADPYAAQQQPLMPRATTQPGARPPPQQRVAQQPPSPPSRQSANPYMQESPAMPQAPAQQIPGQRPASRPTDPYARERPLRPGAGYSQDGLRGQQPASSYRQQPINPSSRQPVNSFSRQPANPSTPQQAPPEAGQPMGQRARQPAVSWYSDWLRIAGCDVLLPYVSARTLAVDERQIRYRGVVHFIGGAFVGLFPRQTYGPLLESIANAGFVVVASPYTNDFGHWSIAKEATFKYREASFEIERILNRNWAPRGLRALPVFGVGHSLGSKLHVLLNSDPILRKAAGQPRTANVHIAFNNFGARESIPFLQQLNSMVANGATSVLAERGGEALRGLGDVLGNLATDYRSLGGDQRRPWRGSSPFDAVKDFGKFIAGTAKSLGAQLNEEFNPDPEDTWYLAGSEYSVPRNLIVKFSSDGIDQSEDLADIFKNRFRDDDNGGGALQYRTLEGTHVTPNTPELSTMYAGGYGIEDYLGQAGRGAAQRVANEQYYLGLALIEFMLKEAGY